MFVIFYISFTLFNNYFKFSGWVDDSVFMQCAPNDSLWINNYSKHAFTTGRHHNMSKSRFKNSNHTMKV